MRTKLNLETMEERLAPSTLVPRPKPVAPPVIHRVEKVDPIIHVITDRIWVELARPAHLDFRFEWHTPDGWDHIVFIDL